MADMAENKPVDAAHLEAVAVPNEKLNGQQIVELAKEGLQIEHEFSPLQAIKAYPMAIFWSLMVSMCVVMEGKVSTFGLQSVESNYL